MNTFPQFEIGQYILCIEDHAELLTKDKVYRIVYIDPSLDKAVYIVDNSGNTGRYYSCRFTSLAPEFNQVSPELCEHVIDLMSV